MSHLICFYAVLHSHPLLFLALKGLISKWNDIILFSIILVMKALGEATLSFPVFISNPREGKLLNLLL